MKGPFRLCSLQNTNLAYTPARPLLNAVFGAAKVEASLEFDAAASALLWDGAAIPASVLVRSTGVAWIAVRPFAEWAHLTTQPTADPAREIRLAPGA